MHPLRLRIIPRRLVWTGLLLAVAMLLNACSTLQLGYHQAPRLLYWWIDDQVDLNDAQTVRLRKDIDAFLAWHRSEELPRYAERLARWQTMATGSVSAQQVCAEFDALREAWQRLSARGAEPLARLAATLSPEQLQHLERQQDKAMERFAREHLRGDATERLERRVERAQDLYDILYGHLSDEQRDLLRENLRASPYDAQRLQTERLRRNADLRQTIRTIQALPRQSSSVAEAAMQGWFERNLRSPVPAYATYSEQLVRNGCVQFAAIHNAASPRQRAEALRVLKGYADDLQALTGPQ